VACGGLKPFSVKDVSYVREREGVLYVGETRVTVSSLVAAWRNAGYTAEELRIGFPALSLAQVYDTIAYYLEHQAELDQLFAEDEQLFRRLREQAQAADPTFYERLEARKARLR
jgi:uncharacterized protein (DUF433 family)